MPRKAPRLDIDVRRPREIFYDAEQVSDFQLARTARTCGFTTSLSYLVSFVHLDYRVYRRSPDLEKTAFVCTTSCCILYPT